MKDHILIMGALECVICGSKTWVFPTDKELKIGRCMECKSTINNIFNQEQIELNIEKIKENQI